MDAPRDMEIRVHIGVLLVLFNERLYKVVGRFRLCNPCVRTRLDFDFIRVRF